MARCVDVEVAEDMELELLGWRTSSDWCARLVAKLGAGSNGGVARSNSSLNLDRRRGDARHPELITGASVIAGVSGLSMLSMCVEFSQ